MAWSGLQVRQIEEAVASAWPGCTFELLDEIDSTNTVLMERARSGHLAPVLLAARRQTAGRGRLGRGWDSSAGLGADELDRRVLTFSLGLPYAPRDWSGLSLAIGASLAERLDAAVAAPRIRLKWPNDLLLDGRKLGGILVETASARRSASPRPADERQVVIGIGLNLDAPPAEGLRTPPAWLGEIESRPEAADVLRRLAGPLLADLRRFAEHGFAGFREAFAARDALTGQPVVLSDGRTGTSAGVDEGGALLVAMPHGIERIVSAEVSVRAVPQEAV